MRALVLAAGKSTRLGELGRLRPKPMLPLRGRPVLEWTLDQLRRAGVGEIVINLHHAPEIIPAHFGDGAGWGLSISYVVEPEILGTAGAVRNARHLLGTGTFLVVYGDTVLDWDPSAMIREHQAYRPVVTMVVDEVGDASRLGVVRWNHDQYVDAFVEKPGQRPELGRWVSAGVLLLEPSAVAHIPPHGPSDLGTDLFPALLAERLPMRVYRRPRPLLLLDTPEQYRAAEQTWAPPAEAVAP